MPLPTPKPYTHVRLIEDKHQIDRFEVRVSTFIEFDDNAGRRAISGLPTRDEALQMAKEIARAKRVEEGF
jgi:hypothetical protein